MIDVKLFGGPDDGELVRVDLEPRPDAIVSTHAVRSEHGGIYQFAICRGWTSRGVYLGPADQLYRPSSLGAPGDLDPGSRGSTPGAPSDDAEAGQ